MFNHKSLLTLLPIAAGVSLLNPSQAQAFTLTLNPVTTFEVGDGFFSEPFDGKGDIDAVFPGNFDTVVLGTQGENSEHAEFDLSQLVIPAGQRITSAFFNFTVSDAETFGLGAPNAKSSGLVLRGYAGNGQADASDFQAGDPFATQSLESRYIQQPIQFDVSVFLKDLLAQNQRYAGFGIRAQGLGAQNLSRIPVPQLVIETESIHGGPTQSVPEGSPIVGLGLLALCGVGYIQRRQMMSR